MYGGEDSSNTSNSESVASNKETLQLSPHIAAHKSSACLIQESSHIFSDSCDPQDTNPNHSSLRLAPVHGFESHNPVYRMGIPTSAIFKSGIDSSESFQSNTRSSDFEISGGLPQDLSSNANKVSLNSVTDHKSLPHIQTVTSHGMENFSTPVLLSDRPSAYYRLSDGTTIAISGQHPTLIVSTLNEHVNNDGTPLTSSVINQQNNVNQTTSTINALPFSLHNTNIPISNQDKNPMLLSDVIPGHILPHSTLSTSRIHMQNEKIIKEELEEHDDQKDLVSQALQATVVHNDPRTGNDQEVIEYNYSAGDIAGSVDCMVPGELICHSTFCPQTNIKPQELLMMNVHVNSSNSHTGKINGVSLGSNVSDISQGNQVVLVQPSGLSLNDPSSIISPLVLSPKRRFPKLNEAAHAARREKIASRMREKRANETEDQKLKRRLREAERMRRKRAEEDDDSKSKRRREAAERARIRRAKLSPDEKELERQKAARRMRLRRQNENEDQKRVRRLKAAERMRRRRASETPEERAKRKFNVALKMKAKRRRKGDDHLKIEDALAVTTGIHFEDDSLSRSDSMNHSHLHRDELIIPEANSQYVSSGQSIVVSSPLSGIPAGILLHNESGSSSNNTNHLIPVDLGHNPQPISLETRNLTSSIQRRATEDIDSHPLPLHKRVIITQGPSASSLTQDVQTHPVRNSESTSLMPTHKVVSSTIINSHHLPHLLHHHMSTQDPLQTQPHIHETHEQQISQSPHISHH